MPTRRPVRTGIHGAVAAFSWIAMGACGSDGEEARRPGQAEVDAFHERYCTLALDCCASRFGRPGNAESCATNLRTRSRGYDPEAGTACLVELERAAEAGQCWVAGLGPSDPCRNIWTAHYGTARPGDPCVDNSDCALPEGGTSVCGVTERCQWQFPGRAGDGPCVGDAVTRIDTTLYYGDGSVPEGFLCHDSDGVHCDLTSDTCAPNGASGATCQAGKDCLSGYCNGNVCEDLVEVGGPCSATRCVDAAYCDFEPAVPLCIAKLPAGSACSSNEECLGGCQDGTCGTRDRIQRLVLDVICTAGGG